LSTLIRSKKLQNSQASPVHFSSKYLSLKRYYSKNYLKGFGRSMETDWKAAFEKLQEYTASLERNRSDLWGVNEELRLKIAALEKGMVDMQGELPFDLPPTDPRMPEAPREVTEYRGLKVGERCRIVTGMYSRHIAVITKIEIYAGSRAGWFTVQLEKDRAAELLYAGEEISLV
jgi:hypothetical protein